MLAGKPATKEQIERLPIRKIDLEFLKEKSLTTEDYTRCSICIGEYENDEEIRTLPCCKLLLLKFSVNNF